MGFYKRVSERTAARNKAARRQAFEKKYPPRYRDDELCVDGVSPIPWQVVSFDEDAYMGLLDDVFGRLQPQGQDCQAEDATMAEEMPTLLALMTSTALVDGKRRQTCTLTIVAEDGTWKGGVRDRDHNVSLWVSSGTLWGVLESLEKALGERPVRWRRNPDASSRTRK